MLLLLAVSLPCNQQTYWYLLREKYFLQVICASLSQKFLTSCVSVSLEMLMYENTLFLIKWRHFSIWFYRFHQRMLHKTFCKLSSCGCNICVKVHRDLQCHSISDKQQGELEYSGTSLLYKAGWEADCGKYVHLLPHWTHGQGSCLEDYNGVQTLMMFFDL